jgi:hypothetical protein
MLLLGCYQECSYQYSASWTGSSKNYERGLFRDVSTSAESVDDYGESRAE